MNIDMEYIRDLTARSAAAMPELMDKMDELEQLLGIAEKPVEVDKHIEEVSAA